MRELNSVLADIRDRSEAAAKSDNPDETRLTGIVSPPPRSPPTDAAQKDALADRKKEAEAKKNEAERTADKRNSQFAIVVRSDSHIACAYATSSTPRRSSTAGSPG